MMSNQENPPPAYTLQTVLPSGPAMQPYNGQTGQNPSLISNPPVIAMQSGQPVQMYTIAQAFNSPRIYENYLTKQSRGLGVTQILVGVSCIVINAVGIAIGSLLAIASIGIWGGIMFIISGSFGISAAQWRTKCKVVSFMVLSIISSTITVPLFICAVIGAVVDDYYQTCYSVYYDYYDRDYTCQGISKGAVAMNALLASLAIIEAVAAIWGSAICCKAACCCRSSGNQMGAAIQYATIQGQPVFIMPQSQLNFGGQLVSYAPPEYSTQQIVTVSAPPYPSSYGQDTASAPPFLPQANNGVNENLEKQRI